MSGKFSYAKGLACGGLVVAFGLVWLTLSNAKPTISQVGDRKLNHTIIASSNVAPSNVRHEGTQNQLEQLRQQFTLEQKALRKQLDSLKQSLESHIALTQHESLTVDADPEWGVVDEQELMARMAREERAQQDELISHLETENVDASWSSWAEAEVGTAFDTVEDANIRIFGTVCRSTFCRVEVAFEDVKTIDRAVAHLMTFVPWQARAFYRRDDEEGTTVALYIYREREEGDPSISQLH